MKRYLNPIAELGFPDSGKIVEPQEAVLLKEEELSFYCPDIECKDSGRILLLKESSKGNSFFSHKPGFGHDIGPETLLHKLAIKWFQGRAQFEVPKYLRGGRNFKSKIIDLDFNRTVLEYNKLVGIVPDVKLFTLGGEEFAIEIVVTSDITEEKKKKINSFGLPTIRINLGEFYKAHLNKCRGDVSFVENHLDELLTELALKEWVNPPANNELGLPEVENTHFDKVSSGAIFTFVLAFLGWVFINRKKGSPVTKERSTFWYKKRKLKHEGFKR